MLARWEDRGEWLTVSGLLLVYQLALIEAAAVRGADYLTGMDNALFLGRSETALPLWVWGWAFVAGAVAVSVGLAFRRYAPQWLGHAALAGLYAGVGYGFLLSLDEAGSWDGIRTANGLLVSGVVLHGGMAIEAAGRHRRRKIRGELDRG